MSEKLEIADPKAVKEVVVSNLGDTIPRITELARSIDSDDRRNLAVDAGQEIKAKVDWLKGKRKELYEPVRDVAEKLREEFDPHIKLGEALLKTLRSGITDYDLKKKREADAAREAANAEQRRLEAEAERKKKEAEAAAERLRLEQEATKKAEAEAKRKEAEGKARAEADRIAKEKAEAERRELEAAEATRKMKEEEDARIRQAEAAQATGNADRADTILERPTPVAPVITAPAAKPDPEVERRRLEAEETERKDREAAEARAAEARARQEEERKKVEAANAEAAEAAKKAAEAKVASQAITQGTAAAQDDRTTLVTTWEYRITDIRALCKGIAEGKVSPLFIGYDANEPEKFRPAKIGKDVRRLKELFSCPGVEAYPQSDTRINSKEAV